MFCFLLFFFSYEVYLFQFVLFSFTSECLVTRFMFRCRRLISVFFFYLFLSVKMTDVEEFVSVAVDEDFVCAVQSKGVLSSLSASEFKR